MRILFVCLGNICRSPLAQGITRDLVKKNNLDWEVDSCGTGHWHVGEPPDPRSVEIAREFGVDISDLRARQFTARDFENFDRIYVMDSDNYARIISMATNREDMVKVDWLLNLIDPGKNKGVPDPYYGGPEGFKNVFLLVQDACQKLIQIRE